MREINFKKLTVEANHREGEKDAKGVIYFHNNLFYFICHFETSMRDNDFRTLHHVFTLPKGISDCDLKIIVT